MYAKNKGSKETFLLRWIGGICQSKLAELQDNLCSATGLGCKSLGFSDLQSIEVSLRVLSMGWCGFPLTMYECRDYSAFENANTIAIRSENL